MAEFRRFKCSECLYEVDMGAQDAAYVWNQHRLAHREGKPLADGLTDYIPLDMSFPEPGISSDADVYVRAHTSQSRKFAFSDAYAGGNYA